MTMKSYDEIAQEAFDAYPGDYTLAKAIRAVEAGHYSESPEMVYAKSRAMNAAQLGVFDVPSSVTGAWEAIYRRALTLGLTEARRQRTEITRAQFPPVTA
jgi:hypothetical protein